TSASTATTSAMSATTELPPPPIESLASIVGVGLSESAAPSQLTSARSEYVCCTANAYVPAFPGSPRNWNSESCPVGVRPPLQVSFWTTASSPEPCDLTARCQPGGGGATESMLKPSGGVRTIFIVVAFSFSVGTARLNSCRSPDSEIAGLTIACAEAPAANTRLVVAARAAGVHPPPPGTAPRE